MKRDMELVRLLLANLETGESEEETKAVEITMLLRHMMLMKDAALIQAEFIFDAEGTPRAATGIRMTWAGHDFLDSTRNSKVWGNVKAHILKPGVSWTFDILKELLKSEAMKQLGQP